MHMNAFYGNWLSHREFHKNFKQPPHKSAESLFKQMIQATEIIAFKDFSRNQNLSFYV